MGATGQRSLKFLREPYCHPPRALGIFTFHRKINQLATALLAGLTAAQLGVGMGAAIHLIL